MKVQVSYKSGKEKIFVNVDNEKMDKIKSNRNIIRYETISYSTGGFYDN